MAELNFNANEVEPSAPFTVLPSGEYTVAITRSEMKATKAGDGAYLELENTILDGEHKNKKIWDRLCLNNRNTTAVEIARRNLSAICHAVGVMDLKDSQQLHNIPYMLKLSVKKDDSSDEMRNEIKGRTKREQTTEYQQGDSNTPPWARK